jgi:hypothetical protein
MTGPESAIYDAAKRARARGWRPFPVDHPAATVCLGKHAPKDCPVEKRGKHPAVKWGTFTASELKDEGLAYYFLGGLAREREQDLRAAGWHVESVGLVNVGIACGPSGLVVVDADSEGAMERLCADLGVEVPRTYRVRTSRGWHWYFKVPPGVKIGNASGRLEHYHCDVRGGSGDGGYVVGAGSVHFTGQVYTAEDDYAETIELPEWLIAEIQDDPKALTPERAAELGVEIGPDRLPVRPRDGWTDDVRYGTALQLQSQAARHLTDAADCAQLGAHAGGPWRHCLFLAARDGWRLAQLGLVTEAEVIEGLASAQDAVWGPHGSPTRTEVGDSEDRDIVYRQAKPAAEASPWQLVAERPTVPADLTGDPSAGVFSADPSLLPDGGSDGPAVELPPLSLPDLGTPVAPSVPLQAGPAAVSSVVIEPGGPVPEGVPTAYADAPVAPAMALPSWMGGPGGAVAAIDRVLAERVAEAPAASGHDLAGGAYGDGVSAGFTPPPFAILSGDLAAQAAAVVEQQKRAEELDRLRRREWAQDTLRAEKREPLQEMSADDFLDAPEPDYLVPDMIYRDGLCTVFGPPGAAKSFHVLDLALSYATGTSWRGQHLGRGRVDYVMAEGQATNTLRAKAWLWERGVDRSELRGWFTAVPVAIQLTEAGIVDYIKRVADRQPDMIILDTRNLMFVGKESAGEDYGAMLRILHSLRMAAGGCAIVLIDHTGINAQDRTRGSNAMKGGVDTEVKVTEEEGGVRLVEMTRDKSSDIAGKQWAFTLKQIPEIDRKPGVTAPAVAVPAALPGEAPFSRNVPDWFDVHAQPALPEEINNHAGGGDLVMAIGWTARFMRSLGQNPVGTNRLACRKAVQPHVRGTKSGKPVSDETMDRAWAALVTLGRLAVVSGQVRSGPSEWVAKDGDPK